MRFSEIKFSKINGNLGEGMYDGREFVLQVDEEIQIEGHFTDEERLFILTQWEIQQ
ncbi:MAG: hypothetical protein K6T85_19295 [Gorillibacterium sp.]|nr:hypothetical protein [Gorillibacterium sp.]